MRPQTICSRSDGQKLSIISDADGHVDGRSLAACNKLAVYPTRARIDASHTRNPPPLRFPWPRRQIRPCETCQGACQKSIQKRIAPRTPNPAQAKVMNYLAQSL